MLLDNYKKQSPIVGVAGLGGGINSYIFLSGGADPYIISRSLRFNPGDTAFLNRNFSAGNRRTYTLSFWIKLNQTSAENTIFGHMVAGYQTQTQIRISGTGLLEFGQFTGSWNFQKITTRQLRDLSAWYHIVFEVDTTLSTAEDRIKFYINGERETSFGTNVNPSQNLETLVNSKVEHGIGRVTPVQQAAGGSYYLADVHFVDGQALAPTNFGETDDNGVWQPKKYDPTALPATSVSWSTLPSNAAFQDSSSQVNSGTFNNILTDDGNYVRIANNYLDIDMGETIPAGVKITFKFTQSGDDSSSADYALALSTASNYSLYTEFSETKESETTTDYKTITYITRKAFRYCRLFYAGGGRVARVYYLNIAGATASERETINYGSNGFHLNFSDNSASAQLGLDYSQGDPGTNNKGMDVLTYSGTNGARSFDNLSFQPDFVWIKCRSDSAGHVLVDSVRGVNNVLRSDSTSEEAASPVNGYVSGFNGGGFALTPGTHGSHPSGDVNRSGRTYVAWAWKAGGTAVSNTDGTITSSCSTNAAYGFSIIGYTGTGSGASIGHGLSSAPKLVIVKNRSSGGNNWIVWATGFSGTQGLYLNSSGAQISDSGNFTAVPTSSVLNLGSGGQTNGNGNNMIAYAWSEVAGFSKFGSFTSATNGTTVSCGFKPKFILLKSTGSGSWAIHDLARNNFGSYLLSDSTGAEGNNSDITVTDTGFRFDNNSNGTTFVYAVFASNPANDWTVNNLVGNAVTVQYGENTSTSNFDSSSTSLTYDTTGFSYNNVSSPKTDTGQANASTVLKSANGSPISWTFSTDSTDRYIWTSSNGINWSSTGSTYPVSSSPQIVTAAWVAWAGGSNASTLTVTFTSASSIDSLLDSPSQLTTQTDSGVGGEITGNYATLSPLIKGSNVTLSEGNLKGVSGGSGNVNRAAYSTIAVPATGAFYCEVTINATNGMVGIIRSDSIKLDNIPGCVPNSAAYYENGNKYLGDCNAASYGASFGVGDTIGIAINNGSLIFYKNGVSQGVATSGLTGSYLFGFGSYNNNLTFNFGQRSFAYPLSNHKSINTANLPTPTIADGSKYFDTKLYNGTGSNPNNITGLSFSPDWIWIKQRSGTKDHNVYDTIRGVTKELFPNGPGSENTLTTGLTSFNSDGFTVSTGSRANEAGNTYASWNWEAGSSTVANTTGSINSQVRASATSGFSIVSYTGTGANATIGHSLSSAPDAVITKCLTGSNSWAVYHRYSGNGGALLLNVSDAEDASSAYWNNTHATSTVFSVGTSAQTNGSGQPFIAYCFSPVESYSSFGSWIGTGSADGPFLYTGFRPAWIMYKRKNGSGNWVIRDTKRSPHNVSNTTLVAESSEVESTSSVWNVDILSNGFKIRSTGSGTNNSGDTYVYFAFAENPFKNSRAR